MAQLDDVIDLAVEIRLSGLVVSNTSTSREGLSATPDELSRIGSGGLSGRPLQKKSTEFIRHITEKTNHLLPVIGSGGIDDSLSAREKMEAGAGLIQIWTGFIYEGPTLVKKILRNV
jgi:dihydroorotate dehydrogenase